MSKIKSYGKRKGGAYERIIARKLSLWISEGRSKSLLGRSSGSGGTSTVSIKKGIMNKEQALDISTVSAEGDRLISRCCIECKFYKDLGLAKFLMGSDSLLMGFWIETVDKAAEVDKFPILIAKQNYFPDIIVYNRYLFNILKEKKLCNRTAIKFDGTHYSTIVGYLDEFLECFELKN